MKRLVQIAVLTAITLLVVIPHTVSQPVPTTNITVLNGQQTVTTSAVNLGNLVIKTLCVKALAANTGNLYLGGSTVSTSNGMELAANQSWCANLSNTNSVYIVAGSSVGGVSWVATK